VTLAWHFRSDKGMLRGILRRNELDFSWMSVNSFEVGAISSAILSTDDLSALVGLHTHQRLIVLRRQDLGSSR
jgi:hypothetical protein